MIRLLDTPTLYPLGSLIKQMKEWVDATKFEREYNQDLINIYRGGLAPYIDRKLTEINGKDGSLISRQTKVVINSLKSVIDKESKVYTPGVVREVEDKNLINQEIVDYYIRELGLDAVMQNANEYYNLNNYVALEPFIMNGNPGLRVLTSSECIPFSDNPDIGYIPNVIIKPMGTSREYKSFGYSYSSENKYRTVDIYWAYSTTEIIIFDSDSNYRDDLMFEYGLLAFVPDETGELALQPSGNPYGVIPYLYITKSHKSLIPMADSTLMSMAIDPSIQYSNINYGLQFQQYGMLVATDLDDKSLAGLKVSPRIIANVKSDQGREGSRSGSLSVVAPTVDVNGGLQALDSKWRFFLTVRGFDTSNIAGNSGREYTGYLDRLVGESNATNLYRKQILTFKTAENVLWKLLSIVHNSWVANGLMVEERRGLTADVQVIATFNVAQPNYDEDTLLDVIGKALDRGVQSRMGALRRYHPDLDEAALEALFDEIRDEERSSTVDGSFNFVEAMANAQTGTTTDG